MSKKTIVFTGGGSAGHVTPNIAIINELNKNDWEIKYIGIGRKTKRLYCLLLFKIGQK
ncbi:glycosyltransferase [Gottfriedia sp. OAE603]|uniref:glycosyltransferase n=1 Tax=Gottfriedia sp. OAE603 TaxID=2663872 RepID=UPI0019ED8E00